MGTPKPEEPTPATRARQQACSHSFIKHMADKTARCVWCGISTADWEQMQRELEAMAYINFNQQSGPGGYP